MMGDAWKQGRDLERQSLDRDGRWLGDWAVGVFSVQGSYKKLR